MAAAPAPNGQKIRLGELLLREGLLQPDQLQRGLEEQQAYGGRLGRHLVDLGFISENTLLDALSRQLRIPRIDLDHAQAVSPDIARYCRADIAERMGFVPVAVEPKGKVLTIAIADPEQQALADIEALTGMRIEARLAPLDAIDRVHRRLYEGDGAPVQQLRGLQLSRAEERRPAPSSGAAPSLASALGPAGNTASAAAPYDSQLQQQLQAQLQAQLQQQQILQMQQMQLQSAAATYAAQSAPMPMPTSLPTSMAPAPMPAAPLSYAPPPYPPAGAYPSYPPPAPPRSPPTPEPTRPIPEIPAKTIPPSRPSESLPPSSRVAPLLPTPEPPSVDELVEQVARLEKTLAAQARALRSLVEVLVDKGLITKAEMARKQQGSK